jgi:hypothetical protein
MSDRLIRMAIGAAIIWFGMAVATRQGVHRLARFYRDR